MNQMVKHFFDKVGVPDIERNIRHAKNQEMKLLQVFLAHPRWTREGLYQCMPITAPESSYVRALNQLERQGLIRKHQRVTGQYGLPVWVYRITQKGQSHGLQNL